MYTIDINSLKKLILKLESKPKDKFKEISYAQLLYPPYSLLSINLLINVYRLMCVGFFVSISTQLNLLSVNRIKGKNVVGGFPKEGILYK